MLVGPLVLGLKDALHVREERLAAASCGEACRLIYVSDIHLHRRRSPTLSRQIIRAAGTSPLDAVLLGGDLIDSACQADHLRELVRELAEIAPVLAVAGNHDCSVGVDLVRDTVVAGGGTWIHDTSVCIHHGSRTIGIAGPDTPAPPATDVRILCAHNPRIWETARHQGYHLVLAGHLHGCQLVAFEFRGRLFPGGALYPHCFLNRQHRSSRLVVSRGVADLVPIRWRCPREVVLCHV